MNFQKQFNDQKQSHDTKENQLQALCNKQQVHITSLDNDCRNLREENDRILTEKEELQKEVMTSSDYIVAVQEKCYQSN